MVYNVSNSSCLGIFFFLFIGQTMESDSYGPLFEANVMADWAAGELSPRSTFNLCYLMRIPEGHRFQDNL